MGKLESERKVERLNWLLGFLIIFSIFISCLAGILKVDKVRLGHEIVRLKIEKEISIQETEYWKKNYASAIRVVDRQNNELLNK